MNEPYALVGEVLTTAGPTQAAVVIRDGKIDAVLREPRSGDLPRKHREFAGFLCPGFIDLQINGAFGADIGPDPEAIRTLVAKLPVRFLSVSLAQAVRMAAETPAAALNLDGKGKIAVGCDADFVLLDKEGTVLETTVAGEMVYEREKSGHP
jgi:N-acetylglucosamine-6-phosphate deacetylase